MLSGCPRSLFHQRPCTQIGVKSICFNSILRNYWQKSTSFFAHFFSISGSSAELNIDFSENFFLYLWINQDHIRLHILNKFSKKSILRSAECLEVKKPLPKIVRIHIHNKVKNARDVFTLNGCCGLLSERSLVKQRPRAARQHTFSRNFCFRSIGHRREWEFWHENGLFLAVFPAWIHNTAQCTVQWKIPK